MFGWMGINQLTGPGRNNWDLALLKNFTAPWFRGEHSTIQFRWETYNTFNHPEWQGIMPAATHHSAGPPLRTPSSAATRTTSAEATSPAPGPAHHAIRVEVHLLVPGLLLD